MARLSTSLLGGSSQTLYEKPCKSSFGTIHAPRWRDGDSPPGARTLD
jgi:hypothetical protein